MRRTTRRDGFTLIEMAISLGLLGMVAASVLSIAVETSTFLGDSDTDLVVQTQATRVFSRIAEVLRKSGRVEDGEVTYPRVTSGGAALEFRLLDDADGNGYGYDESTGALEWSNSVYALRRDNEGNLDVYAGPSAVYHVGRFVDNLQFSTVEEDSNLGLREVKVVFETRKPNPQGLDRVYSLSGSILMRN